MSTRIEEQTRAEIVEAGRRMYARGYVASNDGNISARLDDRRLITTPKSVSKGFMTTDMMVIVDYDGTKLAGERDPSSELPMHLEIYQNRPDVNAVVHAHPPLATGFAVAFFFAAVFCFAFFAIGSSLPYSDGITRSPRSKFRRRNPPPPPLSHPVRKHRQSR